MGQVSSRRVGHRSQHPDHPEPRHAAIQISQSSPLLQLPPELLFLIKNHLLDTPEAAILLSLTCKRLYSLLTPPPDSRPVLSQGSLDCLLVLLEMDARVGSSYFFCSICHILHPFSCDSSLPHGFEPYLRSSHDPCKPRLKCVLDTKFSLGWAPYELGYHHARLIMNRHLYGPPHGLPIESLTASVPCVGYTGTNVWHQAWEARIINNELFLRVTHTASAAGDEDVRHLRMAVNEDLNLPLCPHTYAQPPGTFHCKGDRLQGLPALRGPVFSTGALFAECHEFMGSCKHCLTDHCTTIQRTEGWPAKKGLLWGSCSYKPAGWHITIVSYYRLGKCRSPESWKWIAVTGPAGRRITGWQRNEHYPPGSVAAVWLKVEKESGSDGPGVGA